MRGSRSKAGAGREVEDRDGRESGEGGEVRDGGEDGEKAAGDNSDSMFMAGQKTDPGVETVRTGVEVLGGPDPEPEPELKPVWTSEGNGRTRSDD